MHSGLQIVDSAGLVRHKLVQWDCCALQRTMQTNFLVCNMKKCLVSQVFSDGIDSEHPQIYITAWICGDRFQNSTTKSDIVCLHVNRFQNGHRKSDIMSLLVNIYSRAFVFLGDVYENCYKFIQSQMFESDIIS